LKYSGISETTKRVSATIDDMIAADFPVLFFVGGEPMSRFKDLVDFVIHAKTKMDTRIFTSRLEWSHTFSPAPPNWTLSQIFESHKSLIYIA